jgi:cell division protease FtsH
LIAEKDLPQQLTPEQAVEAAYASELAEVSSKLQRGLPSLIECDKDLAPYLFLNLRGRLRTANLRCIYLDGRPRQEEQQPGAMPVGLIGTMIAQLREAVRGAVERRVVVLPHLDLLTTSQGGLTAEAREVIPLLYENPELVWLGFKDPSFPLPRVIENLFPHRTSILGIGRTRLRQLVTQAESRKFGRQLNPWLLYKHVSGVNAVRLRKLLSTLEGEDYPANPRQAFAQLRQATLGGTLEVPNVDLDSDIGGYDKVKKQLRQEILDVLSRRDQLTDADEISRMEDLIPRGMILWGPPGTGKTFFAKAMAAALGAAITIVSGPELKSKWVGESEDNLRQIFRRARQSAPAIIVFDELDSFASARGTYTGSGVEHSMVNQLLTELDGFHKEELVFVIGTTNFVEILDPALLRPGRFEFHLHIPYPEDSDRREILKIYDRKMRLKLSPEALDYAVERTGGVYETATGTPFSGDHLNALCRAVARIRLREGRTDASTPEDVERGLTEYEERLNLEGDARVRVATHEVGHFLCSVFCPGYPTPKRITIESKMPWALGYVEYQRGDSSRVAIATRDELLDALCVAHGGIEAERLLFKGNVACGAGGGLNGPIRSDKRSDLGKATWLAHSMVEVLGMGEQPAALRAYRDEKGEREILSGAQAETIDRQVNAILAKAQARAAEILGSHEEDLRRLRDEVVEKGTIEGERMEQVLRDLRTRYGLPDPSKKAPAAATPVPDGEPEKARSGSEGRKPAKTSS